MMIMTMRLAGKNVSEVIYFVSSAMYNLNSIDQRKYIDRHTEEYAYLFKESELSRATARKIEVLRTSNGDRTDRRESS